MSFLRGAHLILLSGVFANGVKNGQLDDHYSFIDIKVEAFIDLLSPLFGQERLVT